MEITTDVKVANLPLIDYNSALFFVGSCFAQNIGAKFEQHYFDTIINPFGVLYNPISIEQNISSLIDGKEYDITDLQFADERYFSFDFHGSFDSENADEALKNINEQVGKARLFLSKATHLFVTFGSSVVYQYQGRVVANCHKISAKKFVSYRLSVDEASKYMASLFDKVRLFNPNIQIVATISPVRYLGCGAYEGTLNKATLHLALENAMRGRDWCHYFPAYEIVMDELRDYRFYDIDMIHPSALAVNYIWEKLCGVCFDKQTQLLFANAIKIRNGLNHRPLHPSTKQYEQFQTALNKQIEVFEEVIKRKIR